MAWLEFVGGVSDTTRRGPTRSVVQLAALLMILCTGSCSPDAEGREWSGWVILSPEGATTRALVKAADELWEAAGVHPDAIRMAPHGGIRVRTLSAPGDMAGVCGMRDARNVCGCIVTRKSRPAHVWLHPICASRNLVAHELGHLLAGRPTHLGAEDGCSKRNDPIVRAPHLMCERVGRSITEADLRLVCESGVCVGFEPEAERP